MQPCDLCPCHPLRIAILENVTGCLKKIAATVSPDTVFKAGENQSGRCLARYVSFLTLLGVARNAAALLGSLRSMFWVIVPRFAQRRGLRCYTVIRYGQLWPMACRRYH